MCCTLISIIDDRGETVESTSSVSKSPTNSALEASYNDLSAQYKLVNYHTHCGGTIICPAFILQNFYLKTNQLFDYVLYVHVHLDYWRESIKPLSWNTKRFSKHLLRYRYSL